MKLLISDSFQPLLDNEFPHLVLIGGAGSGKSEFMGRKIFYRSMKERGAHHRFLIMRKVRATIRESVLRVMLEILRANVVPFELNKTERTVVFHNTWGDRVEWLFDGMDDSEKIKSIKDITSAWADEATEFTKEDWMQLDLRIRGETKYYKQLALSLNPDEASGGWLKDEFCWDDEPKTGPGKRPGSFVHHSTVEDNPVRAVREEYAAKLEAIGDATYYAIYRQGRWALAKGVIFAWDMVDRPAGVFYDETLYGLDFGYSVDPAALVRIYRKADEFWLEEVVYRTGLTNPMIAVEMMNAGIGGNDQVYADAAEPKSIQELRDRGFAVYACDKGPDSVRAGIDFLKGMTIHVLRGSDNVWAERKAYKYKDGPDGRSLPVPVDFKNHSMDAVRYAITSHVKRNAGDWSIGWM